jgi:hypothetical protein
VTGGVTYCAVTAVTSSKRYQTEERLIGWCATRVCPTPSPHLSKPFDSKGIDCNRFIPKHKAVTDSFETTYYAKPLWPKNPAITVSF